MSRSSDPMMRVGVCRVPNYAVEKILSGLAQEAREGNSKGNDTLFQ